MVQYSGANVGYSNNNSDIGISYVFRDYIRDAYPNLAGLAGGGSIPGSKTFKAWGSGFNNYSTLGTGMIDINNLDTVNRSSPIILGSGSANGNGIANTSWNWKQIAVGDEHMVAISAENGFLYGWGRNQEGQLAGGLNPSIGQTRANVPRLSVTSSKTFRQVACGYRHTVALDEFGSISSWGDNFYGQLGDGTVINRSTPVGSITNDWRQIACGFNNTLAIKDNGTLWGWGYGVPNTAVVIQSSSPLQASIGGNTWIQCSAGYYNGAAIKTDGTLWTFKYATTDIAGSYSNNNFKQLTTNTDWVQVSAGAYSVAAINKKGELWIIGRNTYGELGDGTIANSNVNMVQTIAGGTNWKKVEVNKNLLSANGASVYATKTDGTLWAWGFNGFGQLGTGDRVHRSSPTQILGGGNPLWIDVSAHRWSFAAIQMAYAPYSNTDY
jgi:alpha-tubulin suppressor-like RCC1 family protein